MSRFAKTSLWVGGFLAICVAYSMFWLSDARVSGLLTNTLKLSLAVAAIAVPLGTLLAVVVVKTNAHGHRAAMAVFTAALFVPLYLYAAAWDAGFGMQGWYTMAFNPNLAVSPWLVGWRGAIWVHAMAAVPWVALIVGVGLPRGPIPC